MKSDFFVQLKKSLEVLMLKDKLYLNDALTIHSLATILQTNSKYLSQLINTEFNKSFVVYINEFRVEEAKKLLLDESNKHLTIEAIGYESGFKSKSAFNSVFKKNTGETPSSFLKKRK
jgi:YesN/AraC family two-component response regulator